MNAAPVIAWCLLMCGFTALVTSLWWYAAHEATKRSHAHTFDALLREQAAHAETRAAHVSCLDDCRRHGISASMRRHPSGRLTVVDGGAS